MPTKPKVHSEHLRIGEVAARSGVSVQAVRYYERRGLLHPVARRPSGYREYSPDAVRVVRFVKQAQDLGFNLDETEELVRLRSQVVAPERNARDEVRSTILTKIEDVDNRLARLHAIRKTLAALVVVCDTRCNPASSPSECPVFDVIDAGKATQVGLTAAKHRREKTPSRERTPPLPLSR